MDSSLFLFVVCVLVFCLFFFGLFVCLFSYYLQMRNRKDLFYLDFQTGHQLAVHFVEEQALVVLKKRDILL